ncbi:AEC family transporter [Rhodobacteraceae bacterium RKSG542]|uniref:AEC family transporter n=1 Tax=Pseudovibrio flavus TaxID=2529854 RepID=UPI0012BC11A9|nr:AEC family transporter [Pseudovibrio flavus]MTI17405.1 AEC family transporter [Pseudovibrio flavus]
MEGNALQVLAVMFPVILAASCGFFFAKRGLPFEPRVINSVVANVAMPSLVISHLAAQHISFLAFSKMVYGAVAVVACFIAIALVFCWVFGLKPRVYLNALCFGNVGNVGLPIVFFAFGAEGMAYALAFWIVIVVGLFTIGIWVPQGSISFRRLVTTPNIYGVVIGVVLIATQTKLPLPLQNGLELIGGACIPLMLMTLGYSIAELQYKMLVRGALIALFHLGSALIVAFGLAHVFAFEGVARGAFILEAVMPSSVFAYLMAERYANEYAGEVASVVLFSTMFALLSLPVVLFILL